MAATLLCALPLLGFHPLLLGVRLPPARAHLPAAAPRLAMSAENLLLKDIQFRRAVRSAGLITGVALLGTALSFGASEAVLDGGMVITAVSFSALAIITAMAVITLRYMETAEPLASSLFRVGSTAGKGQGLFACAPIPAGTYLFDYEGEKLTEEQFFARYPDANGRYIACIDSYLPWKAPSYIDGADPERSGLARWMNHSERSANVHWRKQRLGAQMHFYASTDIKVDDELTFDYGTGYWTALGVQPIED